ncbi:MAG: hypothetical protein KGY74_04100 [Candidatus Cloacimonetes bacterium]|nr:hypothetical protein [Candidatus Cloacimonadota bacterium]
MEVITANKLKTLKQKAGITAKQLLDNPDCEIVHLTLQPSGYLKRHSVPFPVQFYVTKGTATFLLDDKEYIIQENHVLNCELKSKHGIKNNTDKKLIVLVIKHKNKKERS